MVTETEGVELVEEDDDVGVVPLRVELPLMMVVVIDVADPVVEVWLLDVEEELMAVMEVVVVDADEELLVVVALPITTFVPVRAERRKPKPHIVTEGCVPLTCTPPAGATQAVPSRSRIVSPAASADCEVMQISTVAPGGMSPVVYTS